MSGIVRIDATVVKATDTVWLNAAKETHVTAAKLDGKPAAVVVAGDFVGVRGAVKPGPLQIELVYDAVIDHEKSQGIYAAKEGDLDYAYTFFEPIDARRAFPCFDEPAYKVPWQLTFHVQEDHLARANAPIVKETPEPNHMKRVEMAPTKPLPSYLVAFMVGPFDDVDDGVAGRVKTPIHFILPKGRQAELAYAKTVTPKVVVALENYFDMDYPFGKLDVAVVPRFWGTMEHPGIVAMGQSLTLIRPDAQNIQREQAYTNILSHEMAHYWFGDLVTLAWWDDTWLNEALGQWMDLPITDTVEPRLHYRDERFFLMMGAAAADETRSARPTRQPVTTDEGIQASFDGESTYNRGASVFRMLEHYVGNDKWQTFIRNYIRAHAYGNVTADDFIGQMKKDLGAPIADLFSQFVTHPGIPLANVHADCARHQIVVDPMPRAMPAGVQLDADDQVTFTAPVCVRYGDAKKSDRACTLGEPIALAYCPAWIVPNADGFGYYRSKVTAAQARQLLAPNSPAKLTRVEKLMVVADLAAGVQRAEVELDQVLPMVKQLVADADPAIARMGGSVAPLHPNAMDDAMYKKYRQWLAATYTPAAKKLTWQPSPADSKETIDLRQQVIRIAAIYDAALLGEARKRIAQWLKDRTGIADTMVMSALMVVATRGTVADFDAYVAVLEHPRDRLEAGKMFSALGAFVDPALAQRARAMVFDTKYDLRESANVLYVQLFRRETQDAALAAIEQNIDGLLARQRDDENSWFMGAVAGAFCDQPHRDRVAKLLVERAKKVMGAQMQVTRGLEQTDQCIAEVARETPALQRFFK